MVYTLSRPCLLEIAHCMPWKPLPTSSRTLLFTTSFHMVFVNNTFFAYFGGRSNCGRPITMCFWERVYKLYIEIQIDISQMPKPCRVILEGGVPILLFFLDHRFHKYSIWLESHNLPFAVVSHLTNCFSSQKYEKTFDIVSILLFLVMIWTSSFPLTSTLDDHQESQWYENCHLNKKKKPSYHIHDCCILYLNSISLQASL